MAITLENTSTPIDIDAGSGNPVTLTGANTIAITLANMLIVQVMLRNATTVTGISHNGKGLTLARGDGSGPRTEIWYLKNPNVGTFDIVITFSGAGESIACAFGLIGTGGLIGNVNGGTGTGTLASAVLTTIQDASWILSLGGNQTGNQVTAYGGGQTEIWMLDIDSGAQSGRKNAASSREEKTPFGADTQEITWIDSVDWAISCVEIRPLTWFGDREAGYAQDGGLQNNIHGGIYTCPEAGIAESIIANIKAGTWASGEKIKCAIYDANRNFIAQTEERDSGGSGWEVFNFLGSKPSLEANTDYIIVAWSDSIVTLVIKSGAPANTYWYQSQAYGSFPSTLNTPTSSYFKNIYCTYLIPVLPTDKIFLLDKENNLFRIDPTTLAEEKTISLS